MNLKNTKDNIISICRSILLAPLPRNHTVSLVGLIGVGVVFTLMQQVLFVHTVSPKSQIASVISAIQENKPDSSIDPFKNISLEAHAVYVADLKTGTVLYFKNGNEKLPLASVTKLMTAFVAREIMPESAVLTLTNDDLSAEGDSGLLSGERWRLGDILDAMLIVSSNDAAHAVAGFVGAGGYPEKFSDINVARSRFIQEMNEKASTLNLNQMQFFNESGLDVSATQNGGYGSAQNVAQLFAELWRKYPETVEITARKDANISSQNNITHFFPNTDEIVGHIPGLIASKTGYTTLAGGNLAVIFDRGIGDPIVAVVLGSTYQGRFDDMGKLVEAVLNK